MAIAMSIRRSGMTGSSGERTVTSCAHPTSQHDASDSIGDTMFADRSQAAPFSGEYPQS
jgi:hypothetical protein